MLHLKIYRRVHRLNRLLIASLTLMGLLMDGYQSSDAIFCLSVLIWIWLPECNRNVTWVLDQLSILSAVKTDENKRRLTIKDK